MQRTTLFNRPLIIPLGLLLMATAACSSVTDSRTISETGGEDGQNGQGEWLIPTEHVFDGGPGKDGIPSVDNPQFAPANQVNFIADDRLVLSMRIGDTIKAYPHQILDWHEIVNDNISGRPVAVTYCPLTGTGIGWDRTIDGEVTEFGVSGLIYQNNLIPYDRKTNSNWSQMQMRSVQGAHKGRNIETVDMVQMRWGTWKESYPNSQVMTRTTGFGRDYTGYTYGQSYLTNDSYIIFPVHDTDDRLANKEIVHGVISDSTTDSTASVRVYPMKSFTGSLQVKTQKMVGFEHVIAGSAEDEFIVSYKTTLPDGTRLDFERVLNEMPVILEDQEGNRWDVFGYAVSGPRKGQRLEPTRSYSGYWFAWYDFFPNLLVSGLGHPEPNQ